MKATAIANSNIALVKYWGKRDERLFLPMNSSVSMTLDKLNTITTVEFEKKYSSDKVFLDGKKSSREDTLKISRHLDLIRKITKRKEKARVESQNNFPTSAGLASSASGFAALTLAATNALGVTFDKKHLSIIARQGSGSACRSIFGGFVEWRRGEKKDGSDSFAVQIAKPGFWKEFCMLVAVVTSEEKKVKSREGMRQTVSTSPMYKGWIETIERDLRAVKNGIIEKNFSVVGKTAELNALKMHATMITSNPPIIYWNPATVGVINLVQELRENGAECYFTIDAGPQVKVLCLQQNAKRIEKKVKGIESVKETILCKPGKGALLSEKHLF